MAPGTVPVPPGMSPGRTAQWPTALELGESTALFSLSSDGGGGEGRGEESRFCWISPLPNPLPARSSRGEGDRRSAFQCLIQWQWPSGLCYPNTNFRRRPTILEIGLAFALTPALSLGERENWMPLYGESIALGPAGVSALNRGANGSSESNDRPKKDAGCLFPLPAGEGQGEGERDAANRNGRPNFASSIRPAAGASGLCCPKTNFPRRSTNHRRRPPSALVFRALLPPHPALSLGERENRPPRFRHCRAPRFIAERRAVFPLPAGEGQGEGKRNAANQNGCTHFAASVQPAPRVKVGYHIGPKVCRWWKRRQSQGPPTPGCCLVGTNSPQPPGEGGRVSRLASSKALGGSCHAFQISNVLSENHGSKRAR